MSLNRVGVEAVNQHHPTRMRADFGKVAETCEKYLARGRQIYVEGRLRILEYEAKNSGGKRQRTEIVASHVQFLGAPPSDAKAEEPSTHAGVVAESNESFLRLAQSC